MNKIETCKKCLINGTDTCENVYKKHIERDGKCFFYTPKIKYDVCYSVMDTKFYLRIGNKKRDITKFILQSIAMHLTIYKDEHHKPLDITMQDGEKVALDIIEKHEGNEDTQY